MVALCGALQLLSFALGAIIVYRVKREPHETLFGPTPKGEVFSIENSGEPESTEVNTDRKDMLNRVTDRSDEFIKQFADTMAVEDEDAINVQ